MKGFSEALVTDFRLNAPHVKVAVVMPGHIGTDIVINSRRVHGGPDPENMTADGARRDAQRARRARACPSTASPTSELRIGMKMMGEGFRDNAPRQRPRKPRRSSSTACAATSGGSSSATMPLALDESVRADPLAAYSGAMSIPTVTGSA